MRLRIALLSVFVLALAGVNGITATSASAQQRTFFQHFAYGPCYVEALPPVYEGTGTDGWVYAHAQISCTQTTTLTFDVYNVVQWPQPEPPDQWFTKTINAGRTYAVDVGPSYIAQPFGMVYTSWVYLYGYYVYGGHYFLEQGNPPYFVKNVPFM